MTEEPLGPLIIIRPSPLSRTGTPLGLSPFLALLRVFMSLDLEHSH